MAKSWNKWPTAAPGSSVKVAAFFDHKYLVTAESKHTARHF